MFAENNKKQILKWILLFFAIFITSFLILFLYQGQWGFGKWSDSSTFIINESGEKIPINVQAGPGQWRLKQLIICFFSGGALAFAGVLLQKVTRNNLAEVSILGIGSINIMFIFAYVFFTRDSFNKEGITKNLLPLITLVASVIGTGIIWLLSISKYHNRNTFVIIGIALQLLFEAISVVFINPVTLQQTNEGKSIWTEIKRYTLGDIDQINTSFIIIILSSVAISLVVVTALFLRKKIDIYESNPQLAVTLGINVNRLRLVVFMLVAILAGIESFLLGYVALLGLIAPSIARLLFKNKFSQMSIASFLIGGLLVMLGSVISINLGTEIPIGIISTVVAVPYFAILAIRGK
jgi:iron complex transport system permease protein